MKNILVIGSAFIVEIISIFLAHYFLIDIIPLLPCFLLISILLICFYETDLKLLYKGFILAILLSFYDIGMKLFLLREFKDKVDMIITIMVLYSCLALGITTFIFTVLINKKENSIQKIMAIVIFIILMAGHFSLFQYL